MIKKRYWKEYFNKLFNGEVINKEEPVNVVFKQEKQRTEQDVNDITLKETIIAINNLKNWKFPKN